MLNFLKEEANRTRTENGAVTHATTHSDCLDLFATIGALRREPQEEMRVRFDRAWAENPDLALKTLFLARDIRGGLGERLVFRTILSNMGTDRLDTVEKNLWAIPEFGRFDDLKSHVDKAQAKAHFEQQEGVAILQFKVNMKVNKLLQRFILEGGFDLLFDCTTSTSH